ncbi:hypothetical protein TWF696_003631 [Orbilia brochopaga]|uniref:Pentatricopeptide repeat domain-containing protein n=1 Tax=Orbilia brochopaga TaxID=3140254 RepID=A0AAV9TYG2_9PEZI
MLQKVAAPARRSYAWICSDCRRRLGHGGVDQTVAVRAANCRALSVSSSPVSRATTQRLWRGHLVSRAASKVYARRYGSDAQLPSDNDDYSEDAGPAQETREEVVDDILNDSDLDSFAESLAADYATKVFGSAKASRPAHDPLAGYTDQQHERSQQEADSTASGKMSILPEHPKADLSKFKKGPMTREILTRELDKLNSRLNLTGYRLIDPIATTPWPHQRVVSYNKKPTRGYAESIWQKFKRDYIERYRAGDPGVLNGRSPGWKPSVAELKMEYQKFMWRHKEQVRKRLAERKHWGDAPDLRKCFLNTLWILERQTSPAVVEKYGYRTEGKKRTVILPEGESDGSLHQLVETWQEPLQSLDPESYSFVETLEEHARQLHRDELDGFQSPPRMLHREADEFRLTYMRNLNVKDVAAKYNVKLTAFPASSSELLTLIQAMSYERISKADLRYILPPEYNDSVEFISQAMVSLIISHEGSSRVLNTAIFNTAINYLMRKNQIKKGRLLIDYMEYLKINTNMGTWRQALRAAAKEKDLFVFDRLVRRMVSKAVRPNDETWWAFLDCAHTPGQQVQIFAVMKRLGINPKFLAPVHLLKLAFQMYDDQRRLGNVHAKIPWKNLAGIPLRAETLNAILTFLFNNHLHEEARDFLYKAVTVHNVHPDYETLRLVVRFHARHGRPMEMAKAIHIFSTTYGIEGGADIMEAMFRIAHATHRYNVVRTVWAHACLTNQVTERMIDRMRHDIYETGREAGKAGKLALGVCSEAAEAVVKTPIWAMRLVSKSRDKYGYLVSEGKMYDDVSMMNDISTYSDAELDAIRERRTKLREFRENSIEMRKQLMRSDMLAHHKWQPRREFSVDLIRAFRLDHRIKREQPESRTWTPLEWAWHMYQVRRVERGVNVRLVRGLDWLKLRMSAAKARRDAKKEERLFEKTHALLDLLPADFGSAYRRQLSKWDEASRTRAPRRMTTPFTPVPADAAATTVADGGGASGEPEGQQAGGEEGRALAETLDKYITEPFEPGRIRMVVPRNECRRMPIRQVVMREKSPLSSPWPPPSKEEEKVVEPVEEDEGYEVRQVDDLLAEEDDDAENNDGDLIEGDEPDARDFNAMLEEVSLSERTDEGSDTQSEEPTDEGAKDRG